MSRKHSTQPSRNLLKIWVPLCLSMMAWSCSTEPATTDTDRPEPSTLLDGTTGSKSAPSTSDGRYDAKATKRRRPHVEGRHSHLALGTSPQQRSDYARAMIAGDAALYSGLFDRARQEYLKALEARPDKTAPALGALRAVRGRGRGEARSGLIRTIRKKIQKLRAQPETIGAGHLLEARLAIALGRPGDAMDAANMAAELLPKLGVAWRVRGEAAMIAEDWAAAAECFAKAADLGLRAKAGTWERMADALDELGRLADAERAARRAVELTGQDPNALRRRRNLLALILKRRGDLDGAREQIGQARSLAPADPKVLHNAAAIEEATGNIDKALALYGQALELAPLPMTLWRRGRLYLLHDRHNQALAHFRKAAAAPEHWTWPPSTSFWPAFDTAKLYARAKRFDQAIGWFEDAARLATLPKDQKEIRSWIRFTRAEQRRSNVNKTKAPSSQPE